MDETRNTAFAAFLLRISLGVMFVAHGLMKVLVFTVPGTVQYFESIGYPGYFAFDAIWPRFYYRRSLRKRTRGCLGRRSSLRSILWGWCPHVSACSANSMRSPLRR